MVFKNGGILARAEKWTYNNEPLDVVAGFAYAGVYFTKQLSLPRMASEQASKAKTCPHYPSVKTLRLWPAN